MDNNVSDPVPSPGQGQPVVEQTYNTPLQNNGAPPPAVPAPVIAPPPKPKFFDGITLMDVIVGTFVVTGLGLAIWYYRERIKNATIEYPQLRSDIDALKEKAKEAEQPAFKTEF